MAGLRLTVRRGLAYVVDVSILAIVLVPLAFVLLGAAGPVSSGTDIWVRLLLTVSTPAWAYFILTDRLTGGRSLGKRLLGLRTVGSGNDGPMWTASVVRTALKLLPWELIHLAFFGLAAEIGDLSARQLTVAIAAYLLLGIYLVVAALNGGERSIPDFAAGTRVRVAE